MKGVRHYGNQGAEKTDLEDIVETAVDIQRKEVFSFAKYHPEVREDYRKTNDWYGGDTIARNTAIVRFDPPSGNYMEFKKKLFEAFGLFYRQYASPAYDICTKVIVSEDGSVGVMLHAIFNMDFKISDEDLAVVKDCGMAHRYYREDSDVPFEHEGCLAEPDEPADVEEAPMYELRYSGDAMIKDDIVRHSVYDLSNEEEKEAGKESQPREWTTDEKIKYAKTANALGETTERYFTRLGIANEVVWRIGDLLGQAYLLWENAPAEIRELIYLEATCDITDQAMSRAVAYWNNGGHAFKLKTKDVFDADPHSMRDLQLILGLKQGTSISTQGRCEQA